MYDLLSALWSGYQAKGFLLVRAMPSLIVFPTFKPHLDVTCFRHGAAVGMQARMALWLIDTVYQLNIAVKRNRHLWRVNRLWRIRGEVRATKPGEAYVRVYCAITVYTCSRATRWKYLYDHIIAVGREIFQCSSGEVQPYGWLTLAGTVWHCTGADNIIT